MLPPSPTPLNIASRASSDPFVWLVHLARQFQLVDFEGREAVLQDLELHPERP